MREKYIYKIQKVLPKKFHTTTIFADLEGPASLIFALCPPNHDYIDVSKGFMRGHDRIGEYDNDENLIFLWPEYYDEYLPVFQEALRSNRLSKKVKIINYPNSFCHMMFAMRCGQWIY